MNRPPLPPAIAARHLLSFLFHPRVAALLALAFTALPLRAVAEDAAVALPAGVKAVWDEAKAYRETTPTRERICLNGLWRWQPGEAQAAQAPTANWGYFKVPGSWPGNNDYLQKDSQTVFAHPSWKDVKLAGINSAWYERTISVPANWAGRRVSLDLAYLNSDASIFVDGKKAGEIHYPGGDVDLTAAVRPGATQTLSLLVVALPLKGVLLSYIDSAHAREVKGSVPRRGLCGDVYLIGAPSGPRITDVRVATSVRKKEIQISPEIEGLAADGRYSLHARILKDGRSVKEIAVAPFAGSVLQEGRLPFTEKWMPDKLWDLNTPENTYDLEVSLLDASGRVLDTSWTTRFGFREFWIDGKDFRLNGSRIFLSAVPLDNAQIGAAHANYPATRETLARLKTFGINYVYSHNYDCEPGSSLSPEEVLRAADDEGMLVGFTEPHFSHYDWKAADADKTNGYARHAEYFVRAVGNHPSVVMYAMSHNGTGYEEDMNPDMIDGIHDSRDNWSAKNVNQALRAEAIVEHFDPARIVYHHASGNLGVMHDSNFYSNFAPVQEMSDWFAHWAAEGVKPAFTCEYGAPFSWDWMMYRGWYQGKREFGSGNVPWEYCLAEWNSQFFGDRAYRITDAEKANLRWEAGKFRAGALWHRWDYPNPPGSPRLEECQPVLALYTADNWRAFRTFGLSGNSPWGFGEFWKLRDGVKRERQQFGVNWDKLQRPGFSPDYLDEPYDRFDLGYERSDWVPMDGAKALLRNNRPLLAYIAGKAAQFTSKDHVFLAGEAVNKEIVVINNSRESVTCTAAWLLNIPGVAAENRAVTVAPGEQTRIPLRFNLPPTLKPGSYEIQLLAKFSTGESQEDRFSIEVLAPSREMPPPTKIALFDPQGETAPLLASLGVRAQPVEVGADLATYDLLIVGKGALSAAGPAPDIRRVRDGLKVLLFEQTTEALQKRFGFRVNEYGLRQVFPRVANHPVLAGLSPEDLRDWRGDATILSPRMAYVVRPMYGPTVEWNGLSVPHIWRCGNTGNVASALIEKPARGDFFPIIDGGFNLQYSPLLEYREGAGLVVFCQLDVTGRTETEPAAQALAGNLLRYVATWKPAAHRRAVYAGDPAGKAHLEAAGVTVTDYAGGKLAPDQALILGPGGGRALAAQSADVAAWLKAGGNVLGLGLEQEDLDALLPGQVHMKKAEHIAAYFDPLPANSLLAGVGPADVHNRDPRVLPLVANGAQVLGDGVLARAESANLVLCQMPPWQFKGTPDQLNLRRTYRRTACMASRLLANLGVSGAVPMLDRFHSPAAAAEKRWLDGLYLDQPIEWDDPYRHFRW
jgi:beta-galactosidase